MTRTAAPVSPAPAVEMPWLLDRFRDVIAQRLGLLVDGRENDRLRDSLLRLAGEAGLLAYLNRLETRAWPADLDALATELTVGETYFFRHPEQFDALRANVLPVWLRQHPQAQCLRVLSAGCASGEEPYTLAITLQRSCLAAAAVDWEITAFDVNPNALRKAEAARYGEWSLRATPQDLRDLWFRREETGWAPLPTVRRHVRFQQRQVAQLDPFFWAPDSFDVIFCRNMLMYLEGSSLRRAVQQLSTALAPGGVLFLGPAETLHSVADRLEDRLKHRLELRQAEGCFFYQRPMERRPDEGNSNEATVSVFDPHWPYSALMDASATTGGRLTWAPSPTSERFAPHAGQPSPPADRPTERLTDRPRPGAPHMPQGPPTQLDEALLLIEAGQIDEGLRVCTRLMGAATCASLQADVFYIQALALEERGELSTAEWHHQRAAAKDLDFAMPHLRLGLLARRRGEPVAARRELGQALALLGAESAERLRRFGGGFDRDTLRRLCLADLKEPAP